MKRMITVVLALTALSSFSAAAEERLSDSRYLAASRCLAYADVAALETSPADFASLRTTTAAGYRDSAIVARSQHEARNIRSRSESLAREGAQGVNLVRDRMDDACASFIQQGLVRLETNTPAS